MWWKIWWILPTTSIRNEWQQERRIWILILKTTQLTGFWCFIKRIYRPSGENQWVVIPKFSYKRKPFYIIARLIPKPIDDVILKPSDIGNVLLVLYFLGQPLKRKDILPALPKLCRYFQYMCINLQLTKYSKLGFQTSFCLSMFL